MGCNSAHSPSVSQGLEEAGRYILSSNKTIDLFISGMTDNTASQRNRAVAL